MPGKVEWLGLANPDRIPFHFVDYRVAGVNPRFVANLLWKGGLALTRQACSRVFRGQATKFPNAKRLSDRVVW